MVQDSTKFPPSCTLAEAVSRFNWSLISLMENSREKPLSSILGTKGQNFLANIS